MRIPMVRIAGVCASLLLLAACGGSSQNAEMQKKVDELQKQVEEQKKALEAAGEKVAESAEKAGEAVKDAAKDAAQNTKKAVTGAAKAAGEKIDQTKADVAANKSAIEQNKSAIDQNKSAIAQNKDSIATNSSNIEKNRQGVEEAKRMAAPAPYHTLTAGTPVVVRTTSRISTKTSATGSLFEATLEEPLEVDGYLVAPKGAQVEGVVIDADDGGRVKGVASISVGLRSVIMADGRRLPIKTTSISRQAKSGAGKDAAKVGIASGIGAAIGAIAGGGKGAAIGAGVGAGGGTAGVLMTKGGPAEIGGETVLKFALSSDTRVQELKK
jgi:predicted phage tail protein